MRAHSVRPLGDLKRGTGEGAVTGQLHLLLPSNFRSGEEAELLAVLRRYTNLAEPPLFLMRKADISGLPEVIQLLADWGAWVGLVGLAARAFVKKFSEEMAKHAADDLWDAFRDWLKRDEAKPLMEVSKVLAEASHRAGPATCINVGLDIPDDSEGAILVIHGTDPERIALNIARFSAWAERISIALKSELPPGSRPAGQPVITFESDGSLKVEWTVWSGGRPVTRQLSLRWDDHRTS